MPEPYNLDFTRFRSVDLAGLECGFYLKIPRRQEPIELTSQYNGDIEVGQCVAMCLVPAGARIVGAELYWGNAGGDTVLAVGDPYACARLLGPVSTARNRGRIDPTMAAGGADCTAYMPWGTCGSLTKTGNVGDGCGLFYQYTCPTFIQVTNLYHGGYANLGGWQGAALPVQQLGAKWTGGTISLTIEYLPGS